MCNIPQIWVLTYARPWSLSQGSWNRTICARHVVWEAYKACKMIQTIVACYSLPPKQCPTFHRMMSKYWKRDFWAPTRVAEKVINLLHMMHVSARKAIFRHFWHLRSEHGIPNFFRSCGHETPFYDQKGASKIGDSVLCLRSLVSRVVWEKSGTLFSHTTVWCFLWMLWSFVTSLQDDTKDQTAKSPNLDCPFCQPNGVSCPSHDVMRCVFRGLWHQCGEQKIARFRTHYFRSLNLHTWVLKSG